MAASLSERLARHRARRSKGEPTVSAWSSPWPFEVDAAAAVLGGAVVTATATDLARASKDWLFQWLQENRLQSILSARIHEQFAEALGVSSERATTVLSETSAPDREPVIAQAEAKLPSARLARLIRWWVQTPQRAGHEAIAALDRSLKEVDPQSDLRTLESMAEVCPPEDRPWLAAIAPDPLPANPIEWLAETAVRMEAVTNALPDWPVLVAAPETIWRAGSDATATLPDPVVRLLGGLLEPLRPSRDNDDAEVVAFYDLDTSLRSLLRGQGTEAADLTSDLVEEAKSTPPASLPALRPAPEMPELGLAAGPATAPDPADAERRPFDVSDAPQARRDTADEQSRSDSTAGQIRPAPAESRAHLTTAKPDASAPVPADRRAVLPANDPATGPSERVSPERHRDEPSPAEQLLSRLAADPTTAELFVTDARLDGGPAGRRVEVALYSAELELAIEFDESFSVATLEAYRKDRTKDLWLQRRGLLVMRILKQDLEKRLEDVALQIRDVVRERRIRGRRR